MTGTEDPRANQADGEPKSNPGGGRHHQPHKRTDFASPPNSLVSLGEKNWSFSGRKNIFVHHFLITSAYITDQQSKIKLSLNSGAGRSARLSH